jgi:hypothetical protein
MEIQTVEVFDVLIQQLAKIPPNTARHSLAALRYASVSPGHTGQFWRARTANVGTIDLTDTQFTVFYDAAWELARIGVLRPGRVAPRNQEVANDFGDHWSTTRFGSNG